MAAKKTPAKKATAKKSTGVKASMTRVVHLSAVKSDNKSLMVLEKAIVKVEVENKRAERELAATERKLKQTRTKLAITKQKKTKAEASLQSRMRDLGKAAGVVKPKAKKAGKADPMVEPPVETEQQQATRLKAMIAKSIAERNSVSGSSDPTLRAQQDARDLQRQRAAMITAQQKRLGQTIRGRRLYANAAKEMASGAVDDPNFVPQTHGPEDRKGALAGGSLANDLARIQKQFKNAEGPAERESKTSSTYTTSGGDDAKKTRSTKSKDKDGKETKTSTGADVKGATKKMDTINPGSAVPVIVTPSLNEPLFTSMNGINKRMADSQTALNENLENLARVLKRDPMKAKLKDSKDDKFQDDLLDSIRGGSKGGGKDKKEGGGIMGFLKGLMDSKLGSFLKIAGPILGIASLYTTGKKVMHKAGGLGLSLQALMAQATGNKEWADDIAEKRKAHNANDPGKIGMGEGILAALTAAWGGNKVRKMFKRGKGLYNASKGMLGKLVSKAGAKSAGAAAFEGTAMAAGRSAVGKGMIKGLMARAGARFVAGEMAGSAVPGIGNIIMGIAMAAWTIGDIAWAFMSDETKDKIKKALGSAWSATKEVAVTIGRKILDWGTEVAANAAKMAKDLWDDDDLTTKGVQITPQHVAERNAALAKKKSYTSDGLSANSGDVFNEAMQKDPKFASAIKAEQAAATARGDTWTMDRSDVFQKKRDSNELASQDAGAMYQARHGGSNNLGGAGQKELSGAVYDAFRKAGLSHKGALEHTAEIGRENSFNKKTMFGVHEDPANKAINVGMMSWQGDRGRKLKAFLAERGLIGKDGKMIQSQASIDAMAQFSVDEMKNGSKKQRALLQNLQATNTDHNTAVSGLGDDHIKWRRTDPKYAADGMRNRNKFYSMADNEVKSRPAAQNFGNTTNASAAPVTAIPQAGVPVQGQMVDPQYLPKYTAPPPQPIPEPGYAQNNRAGMMPIGNTPAPGLNSGSFVEDGQLQLLNHFGFA